MRQSRVRQGRSEKPRMLSPVLVAENGWVEARSQWKMGYGLKTVMGQIRKAFYPVDETYVILCKLGKREFIVQMVRFLIC